MSKFVGVCTLVLGFGLSASEGFTQTEGLKEILTGKTLTSPKGKTVYVLGSDGTLGGAIAKQNVVGFWDVRDGLWCRTISEPTLHEGEACRVVAVNGSEVTLSGGGQSIIYTMK